MKFRLHLNKSAMHLSDKESLEKDVREAGFSKVKLFYTQTNLMFKNEIDLFNLLGASPLYENFLGNFSEDEKSHFFEELKSQFNEKFGPESTEPMEWEILVCVAVK